MSVTQPHTDADTASLISALGAQHRAERAELVARYAAAYELHATEREQHAASIRVHAAALEGARTAQVALFHAAVAARGVLNRPDLAPAKRSRVAAEIDAVLEAHRPF